MTFYKVINIFSLIILSLYLCVELFIGYSQLFGYSYSNNCLYKITGSFDNPGPYGGFLSLCSCLLIAFTTNNKYKINSFVAFFNWVIIIIASLSVFLLALSQSRAAMLAFFFSMFMLSLKKRNSRIGLFMRNNKIFVFVCALFFVFVAYLSKKPSADSRFFINRINILTITNNKSLLCGRDFFGGAYGETQSSYFEKQIKENGSNDLDWTVIKEHERLASDCPVYPFNEYLGIGITYGAYAMVLFIVIIAFAIITSYINDSYYCYGIVSFAVFALFSYPLHLIQFKIIVPLLLLLCLWSKKLIINKKEVSSKSLIKKVYLISNPLLFLLLLVAPFYYYSIITDYQQNKQFEKEWKRIDCFYNMEQYDYVIEDCNNLSLLTHDKRFFFVYGRSLNKAGHFVESDSILRMGAEISSDPMFWNIMGNNSMALGRYREAEERYKHAFYMVPNRLYPLYLLAKLYHAEGDTVRFLDMADKVELFVPKVESVNTERLRSEIKDLKTSYMVLHEKESGI